MLKMKRSMSQGPQCFGFCLYPYTFTFRITHSNTDTLAFPCFLSMPNWILPRFFPLLYSFPRARCPRLQIPAGISPPHENNRHMGNRDKKKGGALRLDSETSLLAKTWDNCICFSEHIIIWHYCLFLASSKQQRTDFSCQYRHCPCNSVQHAPCIKK